MSYIYLSRHSSMTTQAHRPPVHKLFKTYSLVAHVGNNKFQNLASMNNLLTIKGGTSCHTHQ